MEEIKKEILEFFGRAGFDAIIDSISLKDETLYISLKTSDFSLLIGESGETLFEIQHLLKIILSKKLNKKIYVDLDINDYKKKRIKYLKELAHSLANEVALTKKAKILPPMSAYERRIIHLELATRNDVRTESIGEEPERKVVIKPYP